jgi:hypothetical protein
MIAVISHPSCIGFDIDCETMLKGGFAVITAFVLFIGSVLLLLSAVFGRRIGYLVLAVSFFGWMILLSSLWTFGFYSQGLETPVNLGPRGTEPAWVVEAAGTNPEATYPEFSKYPNPPWMVPGTNENVLESVQGVTTSVQAFLTAQANEKIDKGPFEDGAFKTTDFNVTDIRFVTTGDVSLSAAHAYYTGGGPVVTLFMRHDSGSVPRYSWMFFIGSVVGLALHIPLLDRAEKKRKTILTGGTAPPWYGPA